MKKTIKLITGFILCLVFLTSVSTVSKANDEYRALLPKFSPFPEKGVIRLNGYKYVISIVTDVMTNLTVYEDETDREIKTFRDVSSVFIGKEKIFFIENTLDSTEGKLCTANIDGSGKKVIKRFKSSPSIRKILENYVIYVSSGEKANLCELNLKTKKTRILIKKQRIIEISENKIFSYVSEQYNNPSKIFSYNLDGKNKKLLDDKSIILNLSNHRLYYAKFIKNPSSGKNGKLQIFSVDSYAKDKKTHGKAFTAYEIMFISEDYAYFIKSTKNGDYQHYKLNLNTGKINKSEPLPHF